MWLFSAAVIEGAHHEKLDPLDGREHLGERDEEPLGLPVLQLRPHDPLPLEVRVHHELQVYRVLSRKRLLQQVLPVAVPRLLLKHSPTRVLHRPSDLVQEDVTEVAVFEALEVCLPEVDVDVALDILLWSESQEHLLDERGLPLILHVKDLRKLLLPREFLKAHNRLRLPPLPQYFEAGLGGLGADFGQLLIGQVILALSWRGILLDSRRYEVVSDLFGYEPVVIIGKWLQNGTTQLEVVVPAHQLKDECVEDPAVKGLAVLVVYLDLHLEILRLCLLAF